jgi:hypothetical protein
MSYNNTVCFSINGFQGNMWAGPQSDTGRALSDQGWRLAYWQPVGYNSGGFPLSVGVASGLSELQRQFQIHMAGQGYPGEKPMQNILMSSWSEGSIIGVEAYKHSVRGDKGWPPLSMWKGHTTFGNPYRQAHKWAIRTGIGAVPDPGGSGIGGRRNNLGAPNPETPDWQHDYAHVHDMYTCTPDNDTGESIRLIFDFALTQWSGLFTDLIVFLEGLATHTLDQLGGIFGAITTAISFYSGGTRDHVNYDPMPSQNYLAGIARGLP